MECITSTSKCKKITRWLGVFLVMFVYYLSLIVTIFPLDDKSPQLLDKTVTIEYHETIVNNILTVTNNVIEIAFIGLPISAILILIIFIKIR